MEAINIRYFMIAPTKWVTLTVIDSRCKPDMPASSDRLPQAAATRVPIESTAMLTPASITPDNQRRVLVLRISGLLATTLMTLLAEPLFRILPPVTLLLGICVLWALFAAITGMRRDRPMHDRGLFLQLCTDLGFLTFWLALCGGTANPLTALYLLPVAAAGALLRPLLAWSAVAVAVVAYSVLWFVAVPITVTDVDQAMQMHLAGMWLTFSLSAILLVSIVARMGHALREKERRLAAARERILRDERIVALGSLAAGAAHALGTPLNTLTLLADEMKAATQSSPGLHEDAREILLQVDRCHEIVRSLLADAGLEEGESVMLADWLNRIVTDFRQRRPETAPVIRVERDAEKIKIQPDPGLGQAIANLLDNAADACSTDILLSVKLHEGSLSLSVTDHGPGFPGEALRQAGRTPWSSKENGMGLGLFLAASVAERLGGKLVLCNPGRGAEARFVIPLTALAES